MTSPPAPGVINPARAGGVRVAFYGWIARADDPHTAVQRHLWVVTVVLFIQAPIVGYFVDVGPWNGLRGSIYSTGAWYLDGFLVDGGLVGLLDRTCRADRHADVDRLSRRLGGGVRIENGLAEHGVGVLTPEDPMIAMIVRGRVRRIVGGSR